MDNNTGMVSPENTGHGNVQEQITPEQKQPKQRKKRARKYPEDMEMVMLNMRIPKAKKDAIKLYADEFFRGNMTETMLNCFDSMIWEKSAESGSDVESEEIEEFVGETPAETVQEQPSVAAYQSIPRPGML